MSDVEKNIKEVIYDCCHSLSQPSMQGMKWGEIKDYLTRHIIAQLPQWQPIETAPREVEFRCLLAHKYSVVTGYWDGGKWVNERSPVGGEYLATHWMTLPQPPENET